MDNMCLPQDYIDFLQSGKTLNYNPKICLCGKLELLPLEYLFYSEVYVDSENATFAKFDPHAGEYGYYPVPAVDLVASCDWYSPDGILVWLPDRVCLVPGIVTITISLFFLVSPGLKLLLLQ
ncbi:MAG: hypothetical protein CVU39_21560 [Chloroflexi bacterium HGW-Chloroflexi-10]|nr:MAG: hypothetical protein CVU39_21560 [Chloroflexi bacterium HGW-Chloroflexi-10]